MGGKIYGIIYKVTNIINGKIYIGQTVKSLNLRISAHLNDALCERDNMYFHKTIRKYGKENFIWKIIAKCNSLEELNKAEIEMIEKYGTFENGYNLNLGGGSNAGYKHTEETRKKMSKALSGKNHYFYGKHLSEEIKRKLSEAHKGKKHSEESKMKMSRARKGSNGSFYGKFGNKHPNAKKYIVTTPEGEEIFVHGLANFCRNCKKEKLYHENLIKVANGERKHHKGYKCKRLYEEVIICQK